MTRSIISKGNLATVIAKNMVASNMHSEEEAERFIEWCARHSMAEVANWATEEDMAETVRDYNELGKPMPSVTFFDDLI